MKICVLSLCLFFLVHYELADLVEADDDDCKMKKSHLAPIRLKKDLLCSYDKDVRPKKDDKETKVLIRMLLKSFDFNAHSDSLEVNSWLTVAWQDDHLKWKKEDYDNIAKIPIKSDDIWVPDLAIYNRASQTGSPELISSSTCQVYSTGQVVVVAPMSEKGLCVPQLRRYPFDEQVCKIRIGSWVFSGEELNITMHTKSPISTEDLAPNGEFELVEARVERNPGVYKCCPNNTYPSLNYIFTIKRYSSTIAATYLIPAIIMVALTLATLWLNIESMDRVCVCCANLIIHFLFIENLWWNLPNGGRETPLILIYSRDSLLLAGVAFILTVLLRTMQQATSQNTPVWVEWTVSSVMNNPVGKILFFFDTNKKTIAAVKGEEDGATIIENSDFSKSNSSGFISDWVLFAKVIDKICFVIFVIVYFIMVIGFLP